MKESSWSNGVKVAGAASSIGLFVLSPTARLPLPDILSLKMESDLTLWVLVIAWILAYTWTSIRTDRRLREQDERLNDLENRRQHRTSGKLHGSDTDDNGGNLESM